MATSVISGKVISAGAGVAGVTVVCRLRPAGFRSSDYAGIADQTTTTDVNGAYSFTLDRTADVTPSGTYYELEEQVPAANGGARQWAITVGNASATVFASLVNGPPPSGPITNYLTQAQGDSRYTQAANALVFNVKDHGAAGDGVTDDKATIQGVIALAALVGGIVYFPPGTYAVSAAVYVPSNVTLQGAGRLVSVLKALAGFPASGNAGLAVIASGPAVNTQYTAGAHGTTIAVLDLGVDGTNTTSTIFNNMGINLDYVDYPRIERCRIYNTGGYGAHIAGQNGEAAIDFTHNAKRPMVRDCIFDTCGRSIGEDTLGGGFVDDPLYEGNEFINCGGTAIDNIFVNRGVWRDNVSRGNATGKGGIWSDCGSQGLKIVDSDLDQGAIHIFGYLTGTLVGAPQDILIQGNRLTSPGSGAVLVSAGNQIGADTRVSKGIRVIDNIISGATDNAVMFGDVQDSIIAGNRIVSWNAGNTASANDKAAIRMNSNSTNATARCQNNRVERNIFTSAGGANQLSTYIETLSAKTGGNVFADNTFVTASLTVTLDTGSTVRTKVKLTTHKVYKSADETVNSSTTLQNDDDLLLTVGANEVWAFEFVLSYISTVAFKVAITSPSGATGYFYPIDFADSAGAYSNLTSDKQDIGGSSRVLAPRSTGRGVTLRGTIINGSTAGTLQLQWAQNASDASATTVSAGSVLKAERVA